MNKQVAEKAKVLRKRRQVPILTPTTLKSAATRDIAAAMNVILADVFALFLKTKNFHWHMSGPHFRDYHLMLDEQSDPIFAMTDPIAERVRKIGKPTLRSIGHIARIQRVLDNDAEFVDPLDMLAEPLAAACAPGAVIALSGILAGQEPALLQRYDEWFEQLEVTRREDWIRISGRRR